MAKVLVPTDFSSNSLNAARYAVHLYGAEGNEFIVLNSFMMPRGAASTMWSIDDLLAKESKEGVDGFIARMREEPELAPALLSAAIEHGDLPNVVDRFANDAEPPALV
ncbi:MAG: universal stress protein, partial [Flavobacteriales bacterium]